MSVVLVCVTVHSAAYLTTFMSMALGNAELFTFNFPASLSLCGKGQSQGCNYKISIFPKPSHSSGRAKVAILAGEIFIVHETFYQEITSFQFFWRGGMLIRHSLLMP